MTVVRARYENGNLVPAKALPLAPGEDVSIVVLRVSRAARWDLSRLAAPSDEEEYLSEVGLSAWADSLDAEDEVLGAVKSGGRISVRTARWSKPADPLL